MRKCPNCGELTLHDDMVCIHCQYPDVIWAENVISSRRRIENKIKPTYKQPALPLSTLSLSPSVNYPEILVSPLGDSGEFGYHLAEILDLKEKYPHFILNITLNMGEWAYCWDYGDETDPNFDVYLPPNLPLPALVEFGRFIQMLLSLKFIELKVVLPPSQHAVTHFLMDSGILSAIPIAARRYTKLNNTTTSNPGCDTVLVPLTYIGPETQGQLNNDFYAQFDQLLSAGLVQQSYRYPLHDIVMEAAANADQYGGGGWVIAFLRQEKRGVKNFGHRNQTSFSPSEESHLYVHVFTIGPSLMETTGLSTEWEAANTIMQGHSSRQSGGGLGMPRIIETVTLTTHGTVFISSGGYTRLITPDGLVREFNSAGTFYLPGVHLSAVVPLAFISEVQSGTLATEQK